MYAVYVFAGIGFTVTCVGMIIGIAQGMLKVSTAAQARRWRREYETDYERSQRRMASRVRWRHRLHLPELPSIHRAKTLAQDEEAAIRRARAYLD